MAMTLEELAAELTTDEVLLGGGRSVRVRGLEGWEELLLQRALPRPTAPTIPDPMKGSASTDTIKNFDDPAYLDALEVWLYEYHLAYAAAATGHAGWERRRGSAATPAAAADIRGWFNDCVRVQLGRLSKPLIKKIIDRASDLAAFESSAAMDEAEKNSSTATR